MWFLDLVQQTNLQWHLNYLHDFQESHFGCANGFDLQAIIFWKKVITLRNAAGECLFCNHFVTLPTSNAAMKRYFSPMNIIKCKLKQDAIKIIKWYTSINCHCFTNKMCSKDFVPTKSLLSKFTSQMYLSDRSNYDQGDVIYLMLTYNDFF